MRFSVLVALSAFTPGLALGQATTSVLGGTVTEQQRGIPLAARIDVRNRETGETRHALTDATGPSTCCS